MINWETEKLKKVKEVKKVKKVKKLRRKKDIYTGVIGEDDNSVREKEIQRYRALLEVI